MRDVFDYLGQRGTLLAPDALRWLQAHERPLEVVRLAMPGERGPLLLTMDLLDGQRGARASLTLPSTAGALGAAVRLAATAGARPLAPAPAPPLLPPSPGAPAPPATIAPPPALPAPLAPAAPALPFAVPPALSPQEVLAHGRLPGSATPIEVLKDITGKSTCTGELTDFGHYFNDRLRVLRRMLKQRRELAGVVPIDRIPHQDGVVKLIGMVSDVRKTKNGHRILELEDETGTVPILAVTGDHRAVELGEEAERVLQDEVIGVHARVRQGRDLLYLADLFRPEVPLDFQPRRAPEPALACFLSDTHFGAKTFLQDSWDRFVQFLNGHGDQEQRALAQQVKFVVIAGDVVDGIGVYPGQEPELAIPDIEGQYEFAAKQLARIPERIRVVTLPGNHDAARPAEPQPAMTQDRLTRHFGPNVTQVGNPCHISLMGVEVLAYHGVSLLDYVTNLRGLDVHRPIAIMEEVLKRRHIAPLYGGHAPVAPEFRDYMVVDRVPDIFVTGHLHTCEMGAYRNVTLINAGTWQSQTSYQKTLNIVPQPAVAPVVDLQTGRGRMLDFGGGGAAA